MEILSETYLESDAWSKGLQCVSVQHDGAILHFPPNMAFFKFSGFTFKKAKSAYFPSSF